MDYTYTACTVAVS